jgi:hypothetical protein
MQATGRQVRSPAYATGLPFRTALLFLAGLEPEGPPSEGEGKGPGWPRQAPQTAWKEPAGCRRLEGKSDRRHKQRGCPLGQPFYFWSDLNRRGRRAKARERGQDGPGRPRRRPGRSLQDAGDWKASPIAGKGIRAVLQRNNTGKPGRTAEYHQNRCG